MIYSSASGWIINVHRVVKFTRWTKPANAITPVVDAYTRILQIHSTRKNTRQADGDDGLM